MRTVVLGPPPAELEALIARRRVLGLDTRDEVWTGEYHVAPAASSAHGYVLDEVVAWLRPLARQVGLFSTSAFNLGDSDDYRVPDWGLHRTQPGATWLATAALVVEIESPDDESWEKLGFYAEHGVEEVLIVWPAGRRLDWLALEGGTYVEREYSRLLGEASAHLLEHVSWPDPEESPAGDA